MLRLLLLRLIMAPAPGLLPLLALRLRITSNPVLRCVSRTTWFNSATQQIFEASNGQGVDYLEGSHIRKLTAGRT